MTKRENGRIIYSYRRLWSPCCLSKNGPSSSSSSSSRTHPESNRASRHRESGSRTKTVGHHRAPPQCIYLWRMPRTIPATTKTIFAKLTPLPLLLLYGRTVCVWMWHSTTTILLLRTEDDPTIINSGSNSNNINSKETIVDPSSTTTTTTARRCPLFPLDGLLWEEGRCYNQDDSGHSHGPYGVFKNQRVPWVSELMNIAVRHDMIRLILQPPPPRLCRFRHHSS
jgi:hypothetical protein